MSTSCPNLHPFPAGCWLPGSRLPCPFPVLLLARGTVEIVSEVHLLKPGDKVDSSQAALLSKLGIKPFEYGLVPLSIFDNGAIYDPKILDIKDEDLEKSAMGAIQNVAALSLATGVPTMAAMPHLVINGYKNVLAIALATEYSFPKADKAGLLLAWLVVWSGEGVSRPLNTSWMSSTSLQVKEMLKNPGAFAVAAAPAAAAPAAAAPAAKKPEPESESDGGDMGFSLFD